MNTVMTVIVDNRSDNGLMGEWGLSILIEHDDKKILLDTGASELFAKNLAKLGFNITEIDAGVLSHAHYDHSLGMRRFFADNPKAKFFVRDGASENCYAKKLIFKKYIGMPKHIFKDFGDRIVPVSGDYKLYEGVYLIPHKTPHLEEIGKRELMYVRKNRRWIPDDFSHEQSLVVETDKGLVIFNSCSHAGAVNIINEVRSTFPDKHIYGLVGGLHLFNKSAEEIRAVAKGIDETGIDYVCTGHCTKDRAYGILKETLGDRLEMLKAGMVRAFHL